ncbi:uncharacterized protein LOC129946006 [Eupeodes corollae]|uniref:uncharacterized protein LOC129946006 n=1 Tax=Eupeodes corollae TaxID=290404 RepID=UPI0024922AF7|nr:uncharacterized protein LOC129946006 [Eupeodes corollae]
MTANNINALVGATTRYIAGRNAVQTVYWRCKESGKMYKYNKTFEFDKSQKLPPQNIRLTNYTTNFRSPGLTRK